MDKDLTFKIEEGKFNYRVGAIIIKDNKVLMVRNNKVPYYYSVGGRVKFNETSEEAVIREAFEETGVNFKIDRLGFIHENFFRLKETNEFFHELSFYYYLEVNDDFELVCQSINEYGDEEFLEWLPIDKLSEYIIYPEFFREKLGSSSNKITHIITRDIENE